VKQPYAWAIVNGFKPVENRPRVGHHRGLLAIHAGKYIPYQADCDALAEKHGITLPDDYEVGRIIGFVNMVDCVTKHKSRWFSGPYGYVLEDAVPCLGPAFSGQLGFYRTPFPDDFEYPLAIEKFIVGQTQLLR